MELGNIFSINTYKETHYLIKILGIRCKIPKMEYFKKKRENPYYYYKKHNVDITKIPPAIGQIRNIQLANLALLKELDYVCKSNNITYWLDFGSLLGAIRHKGFIPWDDDIDIGMMRKDYDQIIETFNRSSRDTNIFAQMAEFSENHNIIKICHKKSPHLFVDIFPYDFYGEKLSAKESEIVTQRIKKIRKEYINPQEALSLKDFKQKCESIRHKILLKENNIYRSDLVYGVEYNHNWKKWIHPSKNFFPIKNIEFEGAIFPCPQQPEQYLKDVYGNYMAYPRKIGMGHSMYSYLNEEEAQTIKNLSLQHQPTLKKIITYGTFDVLHYGHINLLKRAKALGDYLIVALSTDEFNKLKNKESYYTYEQRKSILEACKYVDMVIPETDWEQKITDVKKYGINTFVMGDDWEGKFDFLKDFCEVVYLPRTPDVSSTQTKNYLKNISGKTDFSEVAPPKISVIVPVYNVEKFLPKCLNSIINQTFKDIEVICVNDGSTDKSLEILNSYDQKDKRIKIINQENRGLSAARNVGLDNSVGEYISFIDSDDWISLNFLEKMYNAAKENNADIAATSVIRCKKHYRLPILKYIFPETTDDYERKLELCDIPGHCYVWNKLYKRQSIIDSGVRFAVGRIYEDMLFTPFILNKTKTLTVVPGARYYYFRHKNTLVKKQNQKARKDYEFAERKMYEFFKEQNIDVSAWRTITKKLKFLGLTVFKTITRKDKKEHVLFNFIKWKKEGCNNGK